MELFIIWCALSGTPMDTRAFFIRHLAEVAQSTHKNVLSIRGTMTTIVIALSYGVKLSYLEPHFLKGHLNIGTIHHMNIIDNRADTIWLPYQK